MNHRSTTPNGGPQSTGTSTSSKKRRGDTTPGKGRRSRSGLTILDRIVGNDPKVRQEIERESERLDIAQVIYDARTAAGMTQAELARRAGTTQPVIARLEDANYQGHSLRLLQRVADALECQVRISLIPRARGAHRARRSSPVAKDS